MMGRSSPAQSARWYNRVIRASLEAMIWPSFPNKDFGIWLRLSQGTMDEFSPSNSRTKWAIASLVSLSLGIGLASCRTETLQPPPPASPSPSSPSPTVSVTPSPSPRSQAAQALEKRLQAEVAKAAGVAVQSVACPEELPTDLAQPFTCQAKAEGKTFAVAVTANPRNKTSEERQWNTKGLLVLPKLEQTIASGIQAEFKVAVKTNCGGKIRIAKPGETFQCQITDARGQSRAVTVRVDDEAGNVTWKL